MTRIEAIEQYLKYSPRAARVILKIEKWDENLTKKENMKLLGLSSDATTYIFAQRYGLDFRRIGRKQLPKNTRNLAIRVLRKNGWTFQAIADVFKTSRQNIEQLRLAGRIDE